jgi:hypothetical protein
VARILTESLLWWTAVLATAIVLVSIATVREWII